MARRTMAAAFCGSETGASGCSGSAGIGLADTGLAVTPCVMPIWRSSWRAMMSDSPPGRPAIFVAYCESSTSVPIFEPSLSIVSVFIDPKVLPAIEGTIIDLHHFGVPFGIREVIMGLVAVFAFRTADKAILRGNDFNFEPIKEVGFLFIGIFLTMQPALTLIGAFAAQNAEALGVTSFYFGTGVLSGVLDNAPTYVSFLSAAMGKFGSDVNVVSQVTDLRWAPRSRPRLSTCRRSRWRRCSGAR